MKKGKLYCAALAFSILIIGCVEETPSINQTTVEFPDRFTVDIPESISSLEEGTLGGRLEGDGDGIIEGNDIYNSLRYFIAVGEQSAEILEFVLVVGKTLELYTVDTYSFTSNEDGREKRIDINYSVTKDGVDYQYEMLMHDVADESIALQLLWNTSPIGGVAVLKPYNIDRLESGAIPDAMLQIEYSESNVNYDATMIVSITGLIPIENGDINNMKLFAGKIGDIVEVRGNSNHPNVILIDPNFTGGRNYAFVGRGDEAKNIGVVNLALPPSSTTTNNVFTDYSIYEVLENEINTVIDLDQAIIDEILREAHSPAYFNETVGFITSGVGNQPDGFSNDFVDLSSLSSFVPNEIKNLTIHFK